MEKREPTAEQLHRELSQAQRELAELRLEQIASNVQAELLQTLVALGDKPTRSLVLKSIAKQVLEIANHTIEVSESSLFLVNEAGVVIESVLARGATIRMQKQSLVGQVLEKGLAGWVKRERHTGLVSDTATDERWIQLPGQPYTVRSALCVPILRRQKVLGILTLMHPETSYFRGDMVRRMEAIAKSIALVLSVAYAYTDDRAPQPKTTTTTTSPPVQPIRSKFPPPPPRTIPPAPRTLPPLPARTYPPTVQSVPISNLSKLGLYIVVWDGKILYANQQLAEIFGYKTHELASLKTMFYLISDTHYNIISEKIYKCVRGQVSHISCQFLGKCKDGSSIEVEMYGARTQFYGKPVMVGALRKYDDEIAGK